MRTVDIEEARKLCMELVQLKERAMRAGMLKTGHAMEEAVTVVGWELAEVLEATSPNVNLVDNSMEGDMET